MFLINTRDDGRYFSDKDKLAWMDKDLNTFAVNQTEILDACRNQKILVLIHGFNNPMGDILREYTLIKKQISKYAESEYDVVIGFIWPGGISEFDYFRAKINTSAAGKRLRAWLKKLNMVCKAVDMLGHSMAAQVGRMAFKNEDNIKVRNIYSMGAAINNNSVFDSNEFNNIIQSCDRIFIFYTENDRILKYAYRLIEWHSPIGYAGPNMGLLNDKAPEKIRLVDCSDFIADHTGYKRSEKVFRFIGSMLDGSNLGEVSISELDLKFKG